MQFILHIFNRYLSKAGELLYQIDESHHWSLCKLYGKIIQAHFSQMILQIYKAMRNFHQNETEQFIYIDICKRLCNLDSFKQASLH